jgi:alpha/beta superfamily hydrolase
MTLELNGPAGRLETRLTLPAGPVRGAAVIAHPHPAYGGTMHSRVVFEAARGFAAAGFAALRFNFRGVGLSQGTFDQGVGEAADFVAALDAVDAEYAPAPIVAAGYSFGAWVAMRVGARDPRVAALVGIAPPVGEFDFAEMVGSPRPKFLIAAEFDELTPVRTMQRFYGLLAEPREMVVVDGADHLFDGRTGEVRDAIAGLFGDFGDRL